MCRHVQAICGRSHGIWPYLPHWLYSLLCWHSSSKRWGNVCLYNEYRRCCTTLQRHFFWIKRQINWFFNRWYRHARGLSTRQTNIKSTFHALCECGRSLRGLKRVIAARMWRRTQSWHLDPLLRWLNLLTSWLFDSLFDLASGLIKIINTAQLAATWRWGVLHENWCQNNFFN